MNVALPGFERWYVNDYPYTTGGYLITRGGPWKPGEAERVVAVVPTLDEGRHICADHNLHAA